MCFRYSLNRLLGAIALFAVLLCAGLSYLHVHARKTYCSSVRAAFALCYAGIAEHEFFLGQLPCDRVARESKHPGLSWRLRVFKFALPSEAQSIGESDFALDWTDARLDEVRAKKPLCFCFGQDSLDGTTNIMAVVGPGTAFDGQVVNSLSELDGDTILFIEVHNTSIHWMEPGDISATDFSLLAQHLSNSPHGFHVCFADGEVWRLGRATPVASVGMFLTVSGSKSHDRDVVLGDYRQRDD